MLLGSADSQNQAVRRYIEHLFVTEDATQKQMTQQSREKKIPPIQVPTYLGKFIYLMAKLLVPSRILEIGALAGYSTIWLAQALPENGKLISLEINPTYAELALTHIKQANLDHCVEIRVGNAVDLLNKMIQAKENPFDVIFVDADKENNRNYLDLCLQLSRPGTLILIDNLIPRGEHVGYPCNHEAKFVYAFNQYLATHPRLESVLMPAIVGENGRLDGIGIVRVL